MAGKRGPMSQAHKDAISEGHKRRLAAKKKVKVAGPKKTTNGKGAGKKPRLGKMPAGMKLLARYGRGRDVVQCNAAEVAAAVRLYRDMAARIKSI